MFAQTTATEAVPIAARAAKLENGDGQVMIESGSQISEAKIGSLVLDGQVLRLDVVSVAVVP